MNNIITEGIPASSAAIEIATLFTDKKKDSVEAIEFFDKRQSISNFKSTVLAIDIPVTADIEKLIYINDEEFILNIEDHIYYISHRLWSLSGDGDTLLDAEIDLITQAKKVYHLIKDDSLSELSIEAIRMRDFIYGII